MLNLLNNVLEVPWVPKFLSVWAPHCPSSTWVLLLLECPSARGPFKCSRASSARVPDCLECPRVSKCPLSVPVLECLECPSALGVPFECPPSAEVLFVCSLSALWVPKWPLSAPLVINFYNIIGHGLLNSFVEFFVKFFNIYYFCFLGNKMCRFYHFLRTVYKSFKEGSITFLKNLVRFQKTKNDGLQSSLLSKILCYSVNVQFCYCSFRIIEFSLIF